MTGFYNGIFVNMIQDNPFPLYFKFKEAPNFKQANGDNAVNFSLGKTGSNFPTRQETVDHMVFEPQETL